MVIQSSLLPFQLSVSWDNGQVFRINDRIAFCDDIDDINNGILKNSIQIRENTSVIIDFYSDKECRLEMDGFDGIDVIQLVHEDGFYLRAPANKVEVFSNDNFPLPPGRFILQINCEGTIDYTSFVVKPGRLNDSTWQLMAEDVYESIKLLAFQMAAQRMGISDKEHNYGLLGSLLLKMNVIEKRFDAVIAALDGISANPHCKISKKYELAKPSNQGPSDFKSNKLNSRKFISGNGFVPSKYTDYQLNENAFIKRIVLTLNDVLKLFISEIGEKKVYLTAKIEADKYGKMKKTAEYNRSLNNLQYLTDYYVKAKKIKSRLDVVQDSFWFKEVNEKNTKRVPSQSMLDPRYGILSKISKELKDASVKYDIDNRLSFIWHNSSKLYELWGIIKLVETFKNMGFELEEGFNVEEQGNELKISGLSSGDSFVLKKNNVTVKITYESNLCKSENETSIDTDPVYTIGTHVTPDCKIDFFCNLEERKYYMDSLIIDFKYRTKYSIWNRSDSKCRKQLFSYADDTRSIMVSYKDKVQSRRVRPVPEVWALYPDIYNVNDKMVDEDKFVKLISFVPGYQDVIESHLKKFIDAYVHPDVDDLIKHFGFART